MSRVAKGTFEVTLTPEPDSVGETLGRMRIDKTFSGDLAGNSEGTMLAAHGSEKGSAGYVALEEVKGTLAGRTGSFVLQHSGTMDRGTPTQSVTVVPDSGTGELAGLRGTMTILQEDGGHAYEFTFELKE
jgi:hypothetical protein